MSYLLIFSIFYYDFLGCFCYYFIYFLYGFSGINFSCFALLIYSSIFFNFLEYYSPTFICCCNTFSTCNLFYCSLFFSFSNLAIFSFKYWFSCSSSSTFLFSYFSPSFFLYSFFIIDGPQASSYVFNANCQSIISCIFLCSSGSLSMRLSRFIFLINFGLDSSSLVKGSVNLPLANHSKITFLS